MSGTAVTSISIGAKTVQKLRLRILPFVFLLYGVKEEKTAGAPPDKESRRELNSLITAKCRTDET